MQQPSSKLGQGARFWKLFVRASALMPLSLGVFQDNGQFVFRYYGCCAAIAAFVMAVLAGVEFLSGKTRR